MSTNLPEIGHVTTSQVDGLEIRFTRGGQSDGVPILLTSPWPESIYAYRAIWPQIEAAGGKLVQFVRGATDEWAHLQSSWHPLHAGFAVLPVVAAQRRAGKPAACDHDRQSRRLGKKRLGRVMLQGVE